MKFHLIIPASGTGKRFGGKIPKQYIKLHQGGFEPLYYVLKKFSSLREIEDIVIATNSTHFSRVKNIVKRGSFSKVSSIVEGGKERKDSVFNALALIEADKNDIIIIHDAVRPFITVNKIKELINLSKKNPCLVPGLKISDTIKQVDKSNFIVRTIPRDNIWRIQTPQFFKFDVLIKSFEKSFGKNTPATDEAMLCEAAGFKIKVAEGEVTNIKITTRDDLKVIDYKKLLTT